MTNESSSHTQDQIVLPLTVSSLQGIYDALKSLRAGDGDQPMLAENTLKHLVGVFAPLADKSYDILELAAFVGTSIDFLPRGYQRDFLVVRVPDIAAALLADPDQAKLIQWAANQLLTNRIMDGVRAEARHHDASHDALVALGLKAASSPSRSTTTVDTHGLL